MAATVVSMTQAIAAGQELLAFEQSGVLVQNELSAVEDGLDILKFGAPFLVKDKPPVMAVRLTSEQVKVFGDLIAESKKPKSMLTVLLAALWPQILAAIEAIIKNLSTPAAS